MTTEETITVEGSFYTGDSSQAHLAVLQYDAATGKVSLFSRGKEQNGEGAQDENSLVSALLTDVGIPSRLANTQRRVVFASGAAFVTQDNDAIDALAKCARATEQSLKGDTNKSLTGNWVHRLETNLGAVLASVVAIIALASFTVVYGIPIAAKRIAYAVPQPVQNSMSIGTLTLLDSLYLAESELSSEEQERVFALVSGAIEETGITSYAVELRTGIGPNALALPDGTIVLTDEIVELSANDDELLAVIYHEIGHFENRHLLRRVLQSSLLSLGLILASGNVETIDSLIALPTFYLDMSYTRGFEIEADRFALQRLKDRGLSVDSFISIMNKLEDYRTQARVNSEELDDLSSHQDREEEKLLRYFASHPLTADRIALAAEYAE